MAIAVVQLQDKDLPHLTVSVDGSASASPFPSPSSAFLTPPEESSHESSPALVQSMQKLTTVNPENAMHSPFLDGESTPTLATSVKVTDTTSPPITPTPNVSLQAQQARAADLQPITTRTISASSLSSSQRESLTSSRPAPPSPAVSRRASAALSSRSLNARLSRQSKDYEKLASSMTPTVTSTLNTRSSKARSWLVKVRDFAFPSSDERYGGKGPDAPRPNRSRHRSSTLSSSSSSSTPETNDEGDDELAHPGGWGSFRWNTLSNHFRWSSSAGEGGAAGPSHTDFERNFDASSPVHESTDRPYSEDSDAGDEDQDGDEFEYTEDDGPLVPGLYRALYAFEPEGTAEMALDEGQVVKIIARGGGVGWAVVEKEDGEHALVPESYLELVQTETVEGD